MLKYRSKIIDKLLNKLKEVKTGKFNTKIVHKIVDEIVMRTAGSKLTFYAMQTLNNEPVEIWNAGQKIYNGLDDPIEVDLVDNTKDVIIKGNITNFYCGRSQLSTLNLDKSISLQSLDCRNNQLSTLNLDKNINLGTLQCNDNQLSTLSINSINLRYLYCNNNKLSILNVDKNINLEYLDCGDNQLSTLNVDKNIDLNYLDCRSNKLTTLNLDKNIELYSLYCQHNQLSTLNTDKNIRLWTLYCNSNKLTLNSIIQVLKDAGKRKLSSSACFIGNNNHTDFTQPPELVEALNAARAKGCRVYTN